MSTNPETTNRPPSLAAGQVIHIRALPCISPTGRLISQHQISIKTDTGEIQNFIGAGIISPLIYDSLVMQTGITIEYNPETNRIRQVYKRSISTSPPATKIDTPQIIIDLQTLAEMSRDIVDKVHPGPWTEGKHATSNTILIQLFSYPPVQKVFRSGGKLHLMEVLLEK